jgi:hypothetical protein
MNTNFSTGISVRGLWVATAFALAVFALGGCSEEGPLAVTASAPDDLAGSGTEANYLDRAFAQAEDKSIELVRQGGTVVPAEQVTVHNNGQSLTFFPYASFELDESPADPLNLVFAGEVDPVQIRSALLALDGDRTAYGFPAAYPFDQPWTDALGGSVAATWVEGEGWVGSVIQLTVGNYETLRFHLRLYRTGHAGWTLGSAEFEVMIPGTADHQVLHWELAEQLVVADLVRSGLLDPTTPMLPTGPINQAGGFGEIPPEIYNMLPPELTEIVGTAAPVAAPVPIPTDGEGTILNLTQVAPLISGEFTNSITIDYDQFVPRPYCSTGPYDYLYVNGPVRFDLWVNVDEHGTYQYRSTYDGTLGAVPVDVMTGQPIGPQFSADVGDRQLGLMSTHGAYVSTRIRRLTREPGGHQVKFEKLRLNESGRDTYNSFARCLDEEALSQF